MRVSCQRRMQVAELRQARIKILSPLAFAHGHSSQKQTRPVRSECLAPEMSRYSSLAAQWSVALPTHGNGFMTRVIVRRRMTGRRRADPVRMHEERRSHRMAALTGTTGWLPLCRCRRSATRKPPHWAGCPDEWRAAWLEIDATRDIHERTRLTPTTKNSRFTSIEF